MGQHPFNHIKVLLVVLGWFGHPLFYPSYLKLENREIYFPQFHSLITILLSIHLLIPILFAFHLLVTISLAK